MLRVLYVKSGVRCTAVPGVRCTAVPGAWFVDEAVDVVGAVSRRAGDVFVIAALQVVL